MQNKNLKTNKNHNVENHSIDYNPILEESYVFFKIIQNKLQFVTSGPIVVLKKPNEINNIWEL